MLSPEQRLKADSTQQCGRSGQGALFALQISTNKQCLLNVFNKTVSILLDRHLSSSLFSKVQMAKLCRPPRLSISNNFYQ